MQDGEDDEKNSENDEERNDTGIVPGIFGTTPLKRQQKTDDGWKEKQRTEKVKFAQLLLPITLLLQCLVGREEEDNTEESHSSDRQVDIETPAPGESISESTAQTILS